jgi:hypothetical protein
VFRKRGPAEWLPARRIERGYLGNLLRLTLLAPAIVEAMLDERQAEGVTLPVLMGPFSLHWETQCGRQPGNC